MPNRRQRQEMMAHVRSLPKVMTEVDLDSYTGQVQRPDKLRRAWRSRHFTAQLFDDPNGLRLSVQRTTDSMPLRVPGAERPISWDELMAVKRQCGLGDRWAAELLPPDDQVVDVAPMRHLWILADEPPFGWRAGRET